MRVGRVLAKLDAMGITDETVVVFTSGHGEFLGNHGLLHKGAPPYGDLCRVSFGHRPVAPDPLSQRRARLGRAVRSRGGPGRTRKTVQRSRSPLDGKLWELRVRAEEGIARGIYVTAAGRRVVVLHVFVKKSRKTPPRALATARERMKQVT